MALARERLGSFIDLTESNPTRAGLAYPATLLASLSSSAALRYEPRAFGLEAARQAVADDYRRRHLVVPADRIVLTASTSEAYSILFKLLCTPGDGVLVPRPSYPLFEYLTHLDGVEGAPYELEYHGSWRINLESAVRAATARTRAVLLVSPNNPTGSAATASECAALGDLCRARGFALIGDEVFADYALSGDQPPGPSVLREPAALTFSLGGLSKTIGLPQVKLAWIAVGGPDELVRQALERLEVICDAYLSVSTPVQVAAARLLTEGAVVRDQIRVRTRANYEYLASVVHAGSGCTLLKADAGWYAVIRVPATVGEEALVLHLLERHGVLVHPGYFFDFQREAFLVLSLLPAPRDFRAGVARVFAGLEDSHELDRKS
jgi:alanine-synthesizing transaminase